jgi:uncharacterized protein YukE
MPGQINVPQQMGETGPQILAQAQIITNYLSHLKAIVAPYVAAVDWHGQANTSYSDLQNQWNTQAQKLMSDEGTLSHIGTAVHSNWNNNVDTENANAKMWAQ